MRQTFGSTLLILSLLLVSSGCAKFNFAGEDLGNTTLNNSLGALVFVGSCYVRSSYLGEYFCGDVYYPQTSLDVANAQGTSKEQMTGCVDDPDSTFSENKCPTALVTGRCEMTYSADSMGVIGARHVSWYPETVDPQAGKSGCEFFGTLPNISTKWISL